MPKQDYEEQKQHDLQNINTQTWQDSDSSEEAGKDKGKDKTKAIQNQVVSEKIPQLTAEEQKAQDEKRNSPEFEQGLKDILPKDKAPDEAPSTDNNVEQQGLKNILPKEEAPKTGNNVEQQGLKNILPKDQPKTDNKVEAPALEKGANHEKLDAFKAQFDYYNSLKGKIIQGPDKKVTLNTISNAFTFLAFKVSPLLAPLETWVKNKTFQQAKTKESRLKYIENSKKLLGTEQKELLKNYADTLKTIKQDVAVKKQQEDAKGELAQDLTTTNENMVLGATITGVAPTIITTVTTAISKVEGANDVYSSQIAGVSDTAGGAALAGGIVSAITDLISAYGNFKEAYQTQNDVTEKEEVMSGTENVGSGVKSAASGAYEISNLVGDKVAATGAQMAAGGAAVVMGAIEMIKGGYQGWNAAKRKKLLGELQAELSKTPEEAEKNKKLLEAIDLAAEHQGIKLVGGISQVAKGAAMVIGGSLLLASNPIGWMVLGGAAAIGLIYAGYKWYKAKKKKTALVEQQLGIVDERRAWEKRKTIRGEDDKKDPDPMGRELKKKGYHNDANISWWELWKDDDLTTFYNKYVQDTAVFLEQQATVGDTAQKEEAWKALEAMGFKHDKTKADKVPSWKEIIKSFK